MANIWLREVAQEHKTKNTCYLAVQPLPFFLWKSQQETTNMLPCFWSKLGKERTTQQAYQPLLSIQITPCRILGANVATLIQATETKRQ